MDLFKPLLMICALGTTPQPTNPTCMFIEPKDELYPTSEECLEAVKKHQEEFDKEYNSKGLEAWFLRDRPCSTVNGGKA